MPPSQGGDRGFESRWGHLQGSRVVGQAARGSSRPGDGITRRELIGDGVRLGLLAWAAAPLGPSLLPTAAARTPDAKLGWIFGGELAYFRMQPDHIEPRLEACRRAGFNTIQTYVPWNVHESVRGRIDFEGRTRPVILSGGHTGEDDAPIGRTRYGGPLAEVAANTDLAGFLRICVRHGFQVILRPGPFISDEWRHGGLPDWLLIEGYPEIFQRGPHGNPDEVGFPLGTPLAIVTGGYQLFNFVGPSYASSRYLAEVRRWLAAFARFVRPWLRTHGGPVVALQVDDESCFYYKFGPFEVDYHPEMVARYRALTGSEPPRDWPEPGRPLSALVPSLRWQRFKAAQIASFLGTLATELARHGVREPISQVYEIALQPPVGLSEVASRVRLFVEAYTGTAPWSTPMSELNPAAVRAAVRQRQIVIASEMEAGDPLLHYLLIGEGVRGGIGFGYTEGVPDDAIPGLALLARTITSSGGLLEPERRVADTAIVWNPDLIVMPFGGHRYGLPGDARESAERHIPAVATLLARAGLSFDLLDASVVQLDDCLRYVTIWLVGTDILPRRVQRLLLEYVRRGGQLICMPAPPSLDEHLQPFDLLRQGLYPEALASFSAADGQPIALLGETVRIWRGVQGFEVGAGSEPIARRPDGVVCGYRRRLGRGRAVLLGTWLAADSVAERSAMILDAEPVPAGGARRVASRLARARFGARAAAALGPIPRPGSRPPRYLIVYFYPPQRRGGEVIAGGSIAYWDGENVVGLVRVNTDPTLPPIERPPYHPILPEHRRAALRLHGRAPTVVVSDERLHARLIQGPQPGTATVVVANRQPDDLQAVVRPAVGGRRLRLPTRGRASLPAGSALLLPIGYPLAKGVVARQATVQLLGWSGAGDELSLDVSSPAGGELILGLPRLPERVRVSGRTARFERLDGGGREVVVRVTVPGGTQTVSVRW
jgi:hypothetical protein